MSLRRGRRAATGFLKDFQEFALKGNIVDLAIGVIIGGAFGKIIASLVSDVIMPLVNPLIATAGNDWREWTIPPGIKIGSFIGSVIDFTIVALVLFFIIRFLAQLKRKEEEIPTEEMVDEPVPDPAIEAQYRLTEALEKLTRTIESENR
jgi:large conductance mechanosensitive channel